MWVPILLLLGIALGIFAFLNPKFQQGLYCLTLGLAFVWLLWSLGGDLVRAK